MWAIVIDKDIAREIGKVYLVWLNAFNPFESGDLVIDKGCPDRSCFLFSTED